MNPRRAPLRRLGLAAGALGAAAALSLVAFGADATPGHMHCVAHTGTKPPHSHWATFHTDLAPWRGHRCVPAADVSAADLYAMARETATNTGDPRPTDVPA